MKNSQSFSQVTLCKVSTHIFNDYKSRKMIKHTNKFNLYIETINTYVKYGF